MAIGLLAGFLGFGLSFKLALAGFALFAVGQVAAFAHAVYDSLR